MSKYDDDNDANSSAGANSVGAQAGTGTVQAGAGAGQAGAGVGTSNVSRDDIISAIDAALGSRSFQQTENVIDVGEDEATMRAIVNDGHKWGANEKRAYDEYQDLSLTDARQKQEFATRSRDHYDMMMGDNRAHVANLRKIELELLQNGNTAAKLGDNSMWTTDTEALQAAVAVAVAQVLQKTAQKA